MFCWVFENSFQYTDRMKSLNDNRFSTSYFYSKFHLSAMCNPFKFVKNMDMTIGPLSKWIIWIHKKIKLLLPEKINEKEIKFILWNMVCLFLAGHYFISSQCFSLFRMFQMFYKIGALKNFAKLPENSYTAVSF